MSDYGHRTTIQDNPSFVPGCDIEAKAARKKVLEEVERRRRINYRQFLEKRQQLHEHDDIPGA